METTKSLLFKHATTDTFDIPDGAISKERLRELGVMFPINRGVPCVYNAKAGKVFAVRTSRYTVQTMVFRHGVNPVLGGDPRPFWDNVRTVSRSS